MNFRIGVVLELRWEHWVHFREQNLYRDTDGVNLFLCKQRRVRRGDAVDEVLAFGSELENSPATCGKCQRASK